MKRYLAAAMLLLALTGCGSTKLYTENRDFFAMDTYMSVDVSSEKSESAAEDMAIKIEQRVNKLNELGFDVDELEAAFRQRPKALVLCNPSNPCGKVFTRAELELIADMAEKYDTYVITDEVYEHIVYAPYQHTYFATLPGMWERTLSCSSLSKTYSVTGWRLGYIIAPPEIIDRAKKVHDFLTVGAAAPLQEAVVTGLKFGQDYYDDLQAKYTHKKDLFLKGLDDLKIAHTDPQGAYYVLLDIAEFGYESDLAFCEDLAHYVGVGAVPGSSFFREPVNNLIRLHFAKKDETLLDALNRLEGLRDKIKPKHR